MTARRGQKPPLILLMLPALLFAAGASGAALLQDVPQGHWARQAVEQLVEEGWLSGDESGLFKGNQTVTRYQLAKVLAKALERIEMTEEMVTESAVQADGELKGDIQKLMKEFAPELEAMGKKLSDLEKRLKKVPDKKDVDKALQKHKKAVQKQIRKIGKETKALEKQMEDLRREYERVRLTGYGLVVLDNRDYDAKGMSPTTPFLIDASLLAQEGDSGNFSLISSRGDAPPSFFKLFDTFVIDLRAAPRTTAVTDKELIVKTRLISERTLPGSGSGFQRGDSTPLSYPYSHTILLPEGLWLTSFPPSPEQTGRPFTGFKALQAKDIDINSLTMQLKNPSGRSLTALQGGNASVAWSPLTLNVRGFSFQGLKASHLIRGVQTEVLGTKLWSAQDVEIISPDPNDSTKAVRRTIPVLTEFLYGGSALKETPKGHSLRLNVFRHFQDVDSKRIPQEGDLVTFDDYRPFDSMTASAYGYYKVNENISLSAEIARNEHKRFLFAPSIQAKEKFLCDQNGVDKGYCSASDLGKEVSYDFTAKQENGQLHQQQFLDTVLSPLMQNPQASFVGKRELIVRNVPVEKTTAGAFFLSGQYQRDGTRAQLFVAGQDGDFFNLYGGADYYISSLTDGSYRIWGFDLSTLVRGGGFRGFGFDGELQPKNRRLSFGLSYVSGGEAEPAPLSTLPFRLNVSLPSLDKDIDKRSQTMKFTSLTPRMTYKPTKKTTVSLSLNRKVLDFPQETVTGREGAVARLQLVEATQENGSPCLIDDTLLFTSYTSNTGEKAVYVNIDPLNPSQEYVETFDAENCGAGSSKVFVPLSQGGTFSINDIQGDAKDIGGNPNVSVPAAGDYGLLVEGQNTLLKRETNKSFSLEIERFVPRIEVLHQFNEATSLKLSWWKEKIDITRGVYYGNDLKGDIEKQAIKAREKMGLAGTLTFQVNPNLSLEFFHEALAFKMYPSVDGHKETRRWTQVVMRLGF